MDKGGKTTSHQAPAAPARLQLSPFHHNAATTQALKQRQKLLSWPLYKSRHFCPNTLMKTMIHSGNQLTPREQGLTEAGCKHRIPLLLAGNISLFSFFCLRGKEKIQMIECPYCLLNSWLQLSQNSCLIVSDKLFSNSHLFLVKLSELSLSVMLRLCSNPDPLAELPRFVVYVRKTIVQVKQKRKKKILRLSVCKGQKENDPGRSGESVCQTNGQSRWQAAGHRLGEPTGRRKSWEEKLGGRMAHGWETLKAWCWLAAGRELQIKQVAAISSGPGCRRREAPAWEKRAKSKTGEPTTASLVFRVKVVPFIRRERTTPLLTSVDQAQVSASDLRWSFHTWFAGAQISRAFLQVTELFSPQWRAPVFTRMFLFCFFLTSYFDTNPLFIFEVCGSV